MGAEDMLAALQDAEAERVAGLLEDRHEAARLCACGNPHSVHRGPCQATRWARTEPA